MILLMMVPLVYSLDYNCVDFRFKPRVCMPGPENILLRRIISVTPNMTCGTPPSGYCRTAKPSGCGICNSSSSVLKHPSSYINDKFFPVSFWNVYKPTWWQSVTWWDAKQRNLLINNTLKVQLTVSMNKTYDLTGSFKIVFYSSKPNALILEKSIDYGKTWTPYRYYADNCQRRFKSVLKFENSRNHLDVYCEEEKTLNAIQGSDILFHPYYPVEQFWSSEIQNYIKATDFRISLEYPWTDGNEVINQESYLNKYYYDIAGIQIDGRCHCNGHASNCYGSDINQQKCDCQHFTAGNDCERCLPMYNNKTWKAAEANDKPNPCEGKLY